MKPYYAQDGIAIYHADCLKVLPLLNPKLPADAALITDPPYGISYDPTGGDGVAARNHYKGKRIVGDDKPFDPTPFLSLGYSKVVLWGANHYANKLPSSSGWLCWVKIGDGLGRDCSDCELAWTNRQMPARRFEFLWRGMIRGERHIQRVHPTQKPVAVMSWCIEAIGGAALVVDPFMGSGSTLVACKQMGIPAIGIECDEEYCAAAAERLQQTCLFQPRENVLADHPELFAVK